MKTPKGARQVDTLGLMREFLAERLEITGERVVPEARLADLGVDSLMFAEMLFEFEDRANVELNIPSADNLPETVGELISLIDTHLSGGEKHAGYEERSAVGAAPPPRH